MKTAVRDDYNHPEIEWADDPRLILATAHRQESFGESMHHICRAIGKVLEEYHNIKTLYSIHMNPIVRRAVDEELNGCDQVHIIKPLNVLDCHNIMARSYIVLTDRGGIQEEAPSLGKLSSL